MINCSLPLKVKLLVDLTSYYPGMQAGIEGWLVQWYGHLGDCFARIRFPGVGEWDILHRSYEIIDPRWVEEQQKKIASATRLVERVSTAKTRCSVRFEYPGGYEYLDERREAEVRKQLTDRGVPTEIEYEDGYRLNENFASSAILHVGPKGRFYALLMKTPDGPKVNRDADRIQWMVRTLEERKVPIKRIVHTTKLPEHERKRLFAEEAARR
jgi:hypothetical protein